ncbi:MAG: hypothetical protein GAK41_01485 [Burkholderia gladioli]|nr:MAG: hypothetical protein GAK41_01485 [Burkholderia gladioli]
MNHPVPPASLRSPFPDALRDALAAAFGERFSTSEAVRTHHGRDESPFDPELPDAVVFAQSADDGRCCINRARSVDVYAQRSRGQPPIKSDSRVTA